MRNIAIFLVNFYRNYLSIFKLQNTCRFYPTCSEYAAAALKRHGFFKGIFISVARIFRCHPLSPGGYDPVNPSTMQFDRLTTLRTALSDVEGLGIDPEQSRRVK